MENSEVNLINDLREQIKNSHNSELVEFGIMNNEIVFKINDIEYKVTKPTFGNKQELFKAKTKKFNELIKDKEFLFREDLKKQYKDRNIDIDDMENVNIALATKKKRLQEELGEALTKQVAESEYKELKKQIEEIDLQIAENIQKINSLMEFCIEHQLFIFSYSYLIMLVVFKKENDKWIRLWNSYDEFNNTDDRLVSEIAIYASFVIKDDTK